MLEGAGGGVGSLSDLDRLFGNLAIPLMLPNFNQMVSVTFVIGPFL